MASTEPSFDASRFRHVLGHFATGVAVITARGPVGMVVSSFTSVSLEPPLVGFLPDKSSTSWPAIEAAGNFCVNILSSSQRDLCTQFARSGGDKFEGVRWQAAPSGAPVLDGVMAWIDCELTQTLESGDHYIAIGQVAHLEAAEALAPLVFFQGGYQHLDSAAAFGGPTETLSPSHDVLHELARPGGREDDPQQQDGCATEELVDQVVGGYVRQFHEQCVEIAARSDTCGRGIG